jgi:predicted acylesterase/phospholipase RssA
MSGGGFRATIFHLGVIRFLRDFGFLSSVEAISSVSGGSITAAHLVLNWSGYSRAGRDFTDAQSSIRDFTEYGLRNRLVRRDPPYFLHNLVNRKNYKSITQRLAQYYEDELFPGSKTLSSLQTAIKSDNAPTIFLMATTLTQPTSACYFDPVGFVLYDVGNSKISHTIPCSNYPVSYAVAASSAYPVLFSPLRFSCEDIGIPQMSFGLAPQHLTDGGVFENLGLTILNHYANVNPPPDTGGPDLFLISNAGAKIDWDFSTVFSRRRIRSMLRSVEIGQHWAEQRLLAIAKPHNSIDIDIADTVTANDCPQAPAPEVQMQAARIRTDLDSFSKLEWQLLFDHGYCVAKKQVLKAITAVAAADAHSPWIGPDFATSKAQQLSMNVLQWSRARRWRPWVGLDRFSLGYALSFLTLAVAFWLGRPYLWSAGERVSSFVPWLFLDGLGEADLQFLKPQQAFPLGTLQNSHITKEARNAVRLNAELFAQSQSSARAVLLIEQSKPFNRDFRDQTRWLDFDSNTEATGGVAYLIDTNPKTDLVGYREIRMPKQVDEPLRLRGSVEIERPQQGEILVFVLVVEAKRPGNLSDPFPGSVPGLTGDPYRFKLEVGK